VELVVATDTLTAFVQHWGLAAIFVVIALESTGIPLPGEATLISAALIAGTTHGLSIAAVIATAACAAMAGDNLGYLVGRRFGPGLLERYGGRVGLGPARLKLGRYLFREHGGQVVFLGRFVALLRAFAAVLAGVNLFPWRRFLVCNAAGAVVWASLYGAGAYLLGDTIHKVAAPAAILLLAAAGLGLVVLWRTFKQQEGRWMAAAEAAFPDTRASASSP
jgi:membrane protein DedA with SNARE-associated domain